MLILKLILLFLTQLEVFKATECDPDFFLNSVQLIESRGYKAEQHFVTTDDEYILGLHRIVNPTFNLYKQKKPVFLQHGLMTSSIHFLNNSPGRGLVFTTEYNSTKIMIGNNLGFVLADLGYDVWLGNSRGNTYSTNHTYLNPQTGTAYYLISYDANVALQD